VVIGVGVVSAAYSMNAVVAEMEKNGIRRVTSEDQLTGSTFVVDSHCHDLLHFPSDLLEVLEQHPLVEQCRLVLQVGRSVGPFASIFCKQRQQGTAFPSSYFQFL